jgi:hypothetical protein
MFSFFFQSTRRELISFCGSDVENKNKIVFDPNGDEAKFCFRKIENGQYKKGEEIRTRHPNILKSVLTGKSGWGLWRDQWSDGIVENSFTKEEILREFIDNKIEIPGPLLKEFDDFIEKKKKVKYNKYSEWLGSGGMWK